MPQKTRSRSAGNCWTFTCSIGNPPARTKATCSPVRRDKSNQRQVGQFPINAKQHNNMAILTTERSFEATYQSCLDRVLRAIEREKYLLKRLDNGCQHEFLPDHE